tara:strand:+ start:1004 stop:1198 length:195 start_codon:yes stop_codon:yes gene_type:complete
MGGSKPKPPPPPPPPVAPVTQEDENVKSAGEKERKRIYGQKGRQGSQLLSTNEASGSQSKTLLG